jgi:hypothetical protein
MAAGELPEHLSLNAWAGGQGAVSGAAGDPVRWTLGRKIPAIGRMLFAEKERDLWNWKDSRVGWGLILAENESLSVRDRARAADAPAPVRDLLSDRSDAPVFRYRPESPNRLTTLMRYFADGRALPPDIAASDFGLGETQIPYYLLICAPPTDIPWEFQYLLNTRFAVGRLDLDDPGLANYIAALRSGWSQAKADPFTAVVWSTDHGGEDMSGTMRRYVAKPVFTALSGDPSLSKKTVLIDRDHGGATSTSLVQSLTSKIPGLIVTTSHGVTYPAGDSAQLAANLGLLVGEDLKYSAPAEILHSWEPDGAIWYSHACCSAGSSAETIYAGIAALHSDITQVLTSVAAVGSRTAPLPKALLGAGRPARAFIGHVEPTFDYTIRQPETRQALTDGLTAALHDCLYQEDTPGRVGHAFRRYFEPIGTAASEQILLQRDYDRGGNVERQLLTSQLTARDRMSTVILGDPTVRFTWPGSANQLARRVPGYD